MIRAAHETVAEDLRFMRLALALGRRNLGRTAPNPSVGAVLVAGPPGERRIFAQGVTQRGGRPPAARVAPAALGTAARGATLYVTLEPCSHHGRTPPCADAIVAAGVARVVSAMEDPDPRVAGSGHARLRAAGLAVVTGVLEREAQRDQRGHVTRVTRGRPAVLLKLARTLDGFAAGPGPERLRITGAAANAQVHLVRAHADAVLVGVGTVRADDPALTVRLPGLAPRSPRRIVLDSRLSTPPAACLMATAGTVPTLILAAEGADPARAHALTQAGAEVAFVPAGVDGRVDLAAALALLGARGLTRMLVEGGPALAEALVQDDLVDEALLLTGPERLGAPDGRPALGPALTAVLARGALVLRGEALFGRDRAAWYERPLPTLD